MANLFQPSLVRVTDNNGDPVSGAKLNFYLSGTPTAATWFTDQAGDVEGTNPLVADANGLFTSGPAYLDPNLTYRVVCTNADNVQLWAVDPVRGYDEGIAANQLATTQALAAQVGTDAAAVDTNKTIVSDTAAAVALQKDAIDLIAVARGTFPNATANIPQGATGHGAITGGSGGTDGTFALAFTGGNFGQNPTGTFTVSGGAVTAISITSSGYYIGGSISAPTLVFSASAGLSGASASLTTGVLAAPGETWWTYSTSAPEDGLTLYQNNAGSPSNTGVSPPAEADVTTATNLGQAAISDGLRVAVAGTALNGATRFGKILSPGSDPIAAAVTDASISTFARATTAYEQSGPGAFTSFASGAGAYSVNSSGAQEGIAIRPAAENILLQSENPAASPWINDNVTIAASGTNCFGNSRRRITDDTATGFHRVRQNRTISATGTWTYYAILQAGTLTKVQMAMGTVFGNPLVEMDLSSLSATTQTQGNLVRAGVLNIGGGLRLCYMTATNSSTGTSNQQIYLHNGSGINYTGTGAGDIYYHHAQLTKTNHVVAPIVTVGSAVTRNADSLALAETGDQCTFLIDLRDEYLQAEQTNGFLFAWSDGTANNQIALLNSGGTLFLRRTTSGTTINYGGPAASTNDVIAVSYDEGTGAASWAVNGAAQTGFSSGGPSGLTTVQVGANASGAQQINAVFNYFEVAKGIVTSSGLQTLTGATSTGSVTSFDWDDVFVQSDGSGGVFVYHPMKGSADGLDYVKWNLAQKDDGAGNPYFGPAHPDNTGATAGTGSQGLSDGGAWHVRRIGETTFGGNIQQLLDTQAAMFDSTIEEAARLLNGAFFWAIVASASNHGNMLETSVAIMLDGQVITPSTTIQKGKEVGILQSCNVTSFVDGRQVAERHATYTFNGFGLTYIPMWEWQDTATIASGSYPFMLGTKNVGGLYTSVDFQDGNQVFDGSASGGFRNSDYIACVLKGGGYYAKMTAEYSHDYRLGFQPAVSRLRVQDNGTSNDYKAYMQGHRSANTVVSAGDVWRHVGRYEFGLT